MDKNCPPKGNVDPTNLSANQVTANEKQNEQKNELCTSGTPKPITFAAFVALQKAVDALSVPYGNRFSLPPDRSALTNISTTEGTFSEGDLVSLLAYVERAQSQGAESCNCGTTTVEEVDIHIHLVEDPDDPRCESIIAEMSPHYRPKVWHWTHLRDIADLERPVRVTGRLFFDGSHRICGDPKRATTDPKRKSEWEIHPIYRFEVCSDEYCDSHSDWLSLGGWVKTQ